MRFTTRVRSLSTRILLVSGLVLALFGGAGFGVLYQAQVQLANKAMDSLLKNDAFALSALVSVKAGGQFDFEITPLAMTDYQNVQSGEFFRFETPAEGSVLQSSPGSPQIACLLKGPGIATKRVAVGPHTYQVRSVVFQPEVDQEFKAQTSIVRSWVCLTVGVDEAPYRQLVWQTLLSTVPILIALILISIGALLILVRILTRDLSRLTHALQTADFGGTHEFPVLPQPKTAEVEAVVVKLQSLHLQAAEVYREMWLFLGRAAHQLKTPATAIQSTLEVLLRRERTREELIAGLTDLRAGVLMLTVLTQKLMSSSRISHEAAPALEPVDLSEFFRKQLSLFKSHAHERGIRFVMMPSPSVRAAGHDVLMNELFGNLIENAILYSSGGSAVEISWKRNEQGVAVIIRDQGPGFPESVKRALFEPFVRGDERLATGSGLGLSIAKKSAKLLGGDLSLQTSDSTGSVLLVQLAEAKD